MAGRLVRLDNEVREELSKIAEERGISTSWPNQILREVLKLDPQGGSWHRSQNEEVPTSGVARLDEAVLAELAEVAKGLNIPFTSPNNIVRLVLGLTPLRGVRHQ